MKPDAQRQFLEFTKSMQDASHLRTASHRQVEAVADAIGCPEWTGSGCDSKGQCFCAQAAQRVAEIERTSAAQPEPSREFWEGAQP